MSLSNIEHCRQSLEDLIRQFEEMPSSEAFFNIGTAFEVLILATNNRAISTLQTLASDSAIHWLRTGLLESALFSSMENIYHCSLLCSFASMSSRFCLEDAQVIDALLSHCIVAKNELPILSQFTTAFHFSCAGLSTTTNALDRRNLLTMVDKRVLRARTDEYDLIVLLMIAQCRMLLKNKLVEGFGKLNQVLLGQALRTSDLNRIAVLLLIGDQLDILPEYLKQSASEYLSEHNPDNQIMPLPLVGEIDNEYVKRAQKGIKLRGSIAQAIYFTSKENFNV